MFDLPFATILYWIAVVIVIAFVVITFVVISDVRIAIENNRVIIVAIVVVIAFLVKKNLVPNGSAGAW